MASDEPMAPSKNQRANQTFTIYKLIDDEWHVWDGPFRLLSEAREVLQSRYKNDPIYTIWKVLEKRLPRR